MAGTRTSWLVQQTHEQALIRWGEDRVNLQLANGRPSYPYRVLSEAHAFIVWDFEGGSPNWIENAQIRTRRRGQHGNPKKHVSITRKKADKLLAELVRRAAMRPSSRASGWKRYAKYTDAQNALTWTITKK